MLSFSLPTLPTCCARTHQTHSRQAPPIVGTVLIAPELAPLRPHPIAAQRRDHPPKLPSFCRHLKHMRDESAAATAAAAAAAAAADREIDALHSFEFSTSSSLPLSNAERMDDEQRQSAHHYSSLRHQSIMDDVLIGRSIEIVDRTAATTAAATPKAASSPSAPMVIDDSADDNDEDDNDDDFVEHQFTEYSDTDEDADSTTTDASELKRSSNAPGIRLNLDGYEMDRFGRLPGNSRTPTPNRMTGGGVGIGAWVAANRARRVPCPNTQQVIRITMNSNGSRHREPPHINTISHNHNTTISSTHSHLEINDIIQFNKFHR